MTTLTIHEALLVVMLKQKRCRWDYQLLSAYLNVDVYVLPANRVLYRPLLQWILQDCASTVDIIVAHQLADLVNYTCTEQNQRNILWKLTTK